MLGFELTLGSISLHVSQRIFVLEFCSAKTAQYATVLSLPSRIVNFVVTLVNNSLVVVAEVIL